jgi:hypothetical protein
VRILSKINGALNHLVFLEWVTTEKGVAKMNEIKSNLFLSLSILQSCVELEERGGDPCYLGLTDAGGRPFVVALTGQVPITLLGPYEG